MSQFSIIIPSYNDAGRLPRAVKSVLSQEITNWQLIIVDDGSTDNTEEVVKDFLQDSRINFLKKENAGVSAARNTGASKSEGDYLVFLDSDDEIQPGTLKDYQKKIDEVDNPGFISCGLSINGVDRLPKTQKGISKYKYSVIPGSFCIKRTVFEEIGIYDEKLKQGENWEMVARALAYCENKGLGIFHIDSCNLLYHHFKTTDQVKKRDLHRAESHEYLARKYSKNGVLYFKRCDFLLTAAVNYVRAEEFSKARKLFLENFKCNPGISGLFRLIVFEIPLLRRRKWMRGK